MAVNRTDPGRAIPNTRRAPHGAIPAQQRRSIPMPDGVPRAGRSATSRRSPEHQDPAFAVDTANVPRGFPIGDRYYRPAAGHPVGFGDDWDDASVQGDYPPPEAGRPASGARFLRRVGTGRASVRSAVVGGALLIAVLGAGVAAWAMAPTHAGSDPVVVTQVDRSGTNPSLQTVVSPPSVAGPTGSAGAGAGAGAGDGAGTASQVPATAPAAQGPTAQAPAAQVIPSPTAAPPADLGPATVSAIPPGDPGFGWPSTAFGLPAETPTGQPGN